jgi:hypothetical protein
MPTKEKEFIDEDIHLDSLILHCADFITVIIISSSYSPTSHLGQGKRLVRLAEHPVPQLVEKYLMTTFQPINHLRPTLNYHIAESCVRYLLDMEELREENDLLLYPLAPYAARYVS